MSAVVITPRRWPGDEDLEPPQAIPRIIVSSDDDYVPPAVAGAQRLAGQAGASGWTARLTYARAEIPERYFLNGRMAKPRHEVESVAVRLVRPADDARAYAIWAREMPDGRWGFAGAYSIRPLRRYSLKGITDYVTALYIPEESCNPQLQESQQPPAQASPPLAASVSVSSSSVATVSVSSG